MNVEVLRSKLGRLSQMLTETGRTLAKEIKIEEDFVGFLEKTSLTLGAVTKSIRVTHRSIRDSGSLTGRKLHSYLRIRDETDIGQASIKENSVICSSRGANEQIYDGVSRTSYRPVDIKSGVIVNHSKKNSIDVGKATLDNTVKNSTLINRRAKPKNLSMDQTTLSNIVSAVGLKYLKKVESSPKVKETYHLQSENSIPEMGSPIQPPPVISSTFTFSEKLKEIDAEDYPEEHPQPQIMIYDMKSTQSPSEVSPVFKTQQLEGRLNFHRPSAPAQSGYNNLKNIIQNKIKISFSQDVRQQGTLSSRLAKP